MAKRGRPKKSLLPVIQTTSLKIGNNLPATPLDAAGLAELDPRRIDPGDGWWDGRKKRRKVINVLDRIDLQTRGIEKLGKYTDELIALSNRTIDLYEAKSKVDRKLAEVYARSLMPIDVTSDILYEQQTKEYELRKRQLEQQKEIQELENEMRLKAIKAEAEIVSFFSNNGEEDPEILEQERQLKIAVNRTKLEDSIKELFADNPERGERILETFDKQMARKGFMDDEEFE